MGAQRVEIDPVGLEGRVVVGPLEGLGQHAEPLVTTPVFIPEGAGAVEKAEVGTLHVEAHRRDLALVRREVLEDGGEQELDRERLGGEPRDARDVEVGRLGTEQEVGIEIDGRLDAPRRVEPDRDPGRRRPGEIGVHPQRLGDVGVGRDQHPTQRHRLQRLLGNLPQHRRGPEPDLLPLRGRGRRPRGVSLGADHVMQGRGQVGVGEGIRDHTEDHPLVPHLRPARSHRYRCWFRSRSRNGTDGASRASARWPRRGR